MGRAHLSDGTVMDYSEYIGSNGKPAHEHWTKVRFARLKFDNYQCVVCHEPIREGDRFETHHLSYNHLGNEHMRDVVTMCPICHTRFHNAWRKQDFWKGRESGHWEAYSFDHTVAICAEYYAEDKFISKDPNGPNLCNSDTQKAYVDKYYLEHNIVTPVVIDINDIGLFVRNKRYELFFEAEARGLSVEEFLDEFYGKKVRGKNPIRQEAGKKGGIFDHKPASFHRHYKENPNINKLMEEVRKLEESKK